MHIASRLAPRCSLAVVLPSCVNLRFEEIRLLSNGDTHQKKLLQIVSCGQELPGMLNRSQMCGLRPCTVSSCSLRPLSSSEVHTYVPERFYAAGLEKANHPFSIQALKTVFQYFSDVPQLIAFQRLSLAQGC